MSDLGISELIFYEFTFKLSIKVKFVVFRDYYYIRLELSTFTFPSSRFVLTSDVELLPSPGLANNFLSLAKDQEFAEEFLTKGNNNNNNRKKKKRKRTAFAVPTFEIARCA